MCDTEDRGKTTVGRTIVPVDVVVFRKWKHSGDIIALFPEIPTDIHGSYCSSYEHVGQHGAADFHGVVNHTVPAMPEEYDRLARELTLIGYSLKPIERASSTSHQKRRNEARSFAN